MPTTACRASDADTSRPPALPRAVQRKAACAVGQRTQRAEPFSLDGLALVHQPLAQRVGVLLEEVDVDREGGVVVGAGRERGLEPFVPHRHQRLLAQRQHQP